MYTSTQHSYPITINTTLYLDPPPFTTQINHSSYPKKNLVDQTIACLKLLITAFITQLENWSKLSTKLYGLQNILRAKMIAIHIIFLFLNTNHLHKPSHVSIDRLNSIHLMNTHFKHPTTHTNHQTNLYLILQLLQSCTFPLTIHKVYNHAT